MINNSKLAGAKNPEAKDFLSNLPVTNPQVNCLPHKLRSTSQHCLIKRYGVKNGKQTVFFSKRRKNSLLFTQYTSPYCVLVFKFWFRPLSSYSCGIMLSEKQCCTWPEKFLRTKLKKDKLLWHWQNIQHTQIIMALAERDI